MALSQEVIPVSQIIRIFPSFIRPLAARLVTIPNRIHRSRALKHSIPVVKRRLADMDRALTDPEFAKTYTPPNDFLTWTIADAQRRKDASDLDPEVVACRVLVANFVAIETSTAISTGLLYDLLSSDPKEGYIEGIAEEANRVLAENGGKWSKAALANMIRADSAVKETLRLNFSSKALTKEVALPGGVTLEDGLHLPQGARISVSSYGVHRDPAIYPNGEKYDAFRFSRVKEEMEAKRQAKSPTSPTTKHFPNGDANGRIPQTTPRPDPSRTADLIKEKNLSMVATSENFLAFGHSRHACPGRFFAANEIKLMLAYMSTKYEMQPLPERPKGSMLGEFVVPDMVKSIKVRRRMGTV
jgi:cytochrome P450